MSKPVKHKAVFMKKKILFTCLSVLGLNQLIFGGNGNTQGTAFRANRISRTARITLNASLKTVFPLFGPIEEKKWAHGWDPRIIFPVTNRLEQKMIFKTRQKDKDEADYIWVVSSLIPQQALIEYTIFASDMVGWITVHCQEGLSSQTTRAKITYTFTGLTEKGNIHIAKHLARIFAHNLKDWEEAINYFLKTGKTFRGIK